uniref:Uncharacterized protein n=1 Tax=Oryza barthii TaxID=65489 RepID=A0A0D3GLI9_9ORYZ
MATVAPCVDADGRRRVRVLDGWPLLCSSPSPPHHRRPPSFATANRVRRCLHTTRCRRLPPPPSGGHLAAVSAGDRCLDDSRRRGFDLWEGLALSSTFSTPRRWKEGILSAGGGALTSDAEVLLVLSMLPILLLLSAVALGSSVLELESNEGKT